MKRFHGSRLPSSVFRLFFFSPAPLLHCSPALLFLVLLALAFAGPIFSQQRWERKYGGLNTDEGQSVQQTTDGGYIVTGITMSYGAGFEDVYLIKVNSSGDTLWTKTFGGTNYEEGHSVEQTTDGGYIISGWTFSFGAGECDVYLIKTNASGDTLWTRTYGGADGDMGYSVQQTSDGGYIIAGYTYSYGAGNCDVYLIKTNASGDTLWTRTYGDTSADFSRSVQQTSDGGYVVVGRTDSFGNGIQVYLIKTNASGDTLWTRTYGGTNVDVAGSVQQTSDGGYIITGTTVSFTGNLNEVYLIKTDSSGDTLWTRTYGGSYYDDGRDVRQTSDGGYIICATTMSFGSGDVDVWLIKTNATGDTLWTRTYGGTNFDVGLSVRQTTDGGYVVAGSTSSFGDSCQVYLIKTDSLGRSTGVEEKPCSRLTPYNSHLTPSPNPFASFTTIPGHSSKRFSLYDISGRKVGLYKGDRIGEELSAGVYFLKPENGGAKPFRIVKLR